MKPYIELFINNQKVYFRNPPEIFITYAHTDLHNPTVVKNSYTKTITIDGTPENNRIFNNFADMTRVNNSNLFNASRKETFTLYRNGEPIETGYVKLDKVNKNNGKITYEITLYGGLGEFLYNLQYKDSGEQMKLSDLEYNTDFNFVVNKTVVRDAWLRLTGLNNNVANGKLYDIINFAPCYNGIPKDFGSDKVAIDVKSFQNNNPELYKQFIISKDGYGLIKNKWLLGELATEYDEWQTKDLRSYLQRPVIRFKEIIDACCNPINNGGYTVDLDDEFFSVNNPYYENAWMTLPLIPETQTEVDDKPYLNGYQIYFTNNGNDGAFKISCDFSLTARGTNTNKKLKTGLSVYYQGNAQPQALYNKATYVQLVVYNNKGEIIAGSPIKSFYTFVKGANDFKYSPAYEAPIEVINGEYEYVNYSHIFNGTQFQIETPTFSDLSGYAELIIKTVECVKNGVNAGSSLLFTQDNVPISVYYDNIVNDVVVTNLLELYGKTIKKENILNTEKTPCDYFLSYLKMFNLHIWKDMYDKKIYIRTRKNYFSGEIVDIDHLIDRGNDITITPLTFENKYLNFTCEVEDDEKLHKDYKGEYGIDYGIQKVDTNYAFDSSSKDILENYVFKGCILYRGKSRYYINQYQQYSTDDVFYQPYCLDGFKTLLFNSSGDTTEGATITPKTSVKSYGWFKDKFYDLTPKPNFTDGENSPTDGANVLLFYNGMEKTIDTDGNRIRFQISDDIPEFLQLNDNQPCWIWSLDPDICVEDMDYLPMFSRYITNSNNWISDSWDFGTPKNLYVQDYSIDESSSIYSKYWKNYMKDQYDDDTRVVECKVLLKERVIGDWLQRFYYWDGRYWVLNKITDYNPTSNGTTKCEFVSVNNIENYLS